MSVSDWDQVLDDGGLLEYRPDAQGI